MGKIFKKGGNFGTVRVIAHDPHEQALSLERGKVSHNVSSAAKHRGFPDGAKNGDRCFWRDPLDATIRKVIQHHVPQTKNTHVRNSRQNL
jgi:hypothetical protein